MLNWLRKLFSNSDRTGSLWAGEGTPESSSSAQPDYTSIRIDELSVEPDDPNDFDREACEKLLTKIAESGAATVDDIGNIAVSLEDFFIGNRCRFSIAANAELESPYDTVEAWYQLLKDIRDADGVDDVMVAISMIEPYEDGRVGMWPYSDTIWIYSSLDREEVASLASPIKPDEVRDASVQDPNWDLTPPIAPNNRVQPYWVWWD